HSYGFLYLECCWRTWSDIDVYAISD
ncbi:hypothetical protein A2U01_0109998, partial [Trifolium medium]|nr:hypothetical protein [Trifolium medium]